MCSQLDTSSLSKPYSRSHFSNLLVNFFLNFLVEIDKSEHIDPKPSNLAFSFALLLLNTLFYRPIYLNCSMIFCLLMH